MVKMLLDMSVNSNRKKLILPTGWWLGVLAVIPGMSYGLFGFGSDHFYSVVIDAGSSSSKLLICVFDKQSDRLQLKKDELYETFKPGLSDFDDEPQGIKAQINKILKRAEEFVPKGKWKDTPVMFRATAGFRLLSREKQKILLEEVNKALAECNFKQMTDSVSILSESDEGLFGWIAANLLADRLYKGAGAMLATLDLGGASTQITFPLTQDYFRQFPYQVRWTLIAGQRINFYTHSFIGLGMGASTVKVLAIDNPEGSIFRSPCISAADNGRIYNYNGDSYEVHATGEDVDINSCTDNVRTYLKSFNIRNYDPILHYDVMAISGFYFALRDAGEIDAKTGGKISVDKIKSTAYKVCKTSGRHDDPFLCLHLLYIHTLLADGYKFPPTTEVLVKSNMDGHHTNWALGLAYYTLESSALF